MNRYTDGLVDVPEHTTSSGKVCVVMFSGGRDSTLAALRLLRRKYRLLLITVTSDHLTGIHLVRRRLDEFRLKLAMRATWIHVVQPPRFASAMRTGHRNCLPCHAAYFGLGLRFALDNKAPNVAFGYTEYQSNWLEQTPQAIKILRHHLKTHGLELLLPAFDLSSKAEAVRELRSAGLNPDALEQKCLVQQFNNTLCPAELTAELARWDQALERTFQLAQQENLQVIQRITLDSTGLSHG